MRDLRRSGEAVLLCIALVLSSNAFAPLWTNTTAHDVVEGGPALQLVWAAIYTILVILLARQRTLPSLLASTKLLAILIAFCFLSALWSADPAVTFRKACAILGATLVGVLLASDFDPDQQLNLVASALGITAVASLIASLFLASHFPATELAPTAWHGVFSHKNLLGRAMSLACVAFLCLERRNLPRSLFAFTGIALCLGLIIASQSRTALLVLILVSSASLASTLFRLEWRQACGGALLLLTICIPLTCIAVADPTQAIAFLHRDLTLTGRARIWEFALDAFTRRPWFGYGYGAFWWVAPDSRQTIALLCYQTPNAHNGFLDLGLQLGSIGLALFVVGWLAAFYRSIRFATRVPHRSAGWPMLFLLFLLLYSFTESSLLAPNSLLWILYAAACVTVSRPQESEATA